MRKSIFYSSTTILVLMLAANAYSQTGEQLFKSNCSSCHSVGKGKLVGPDLKDVDTRHNQTWLLKWVKSSQTMVKAGDKDAVQLFNDNNSIPMPDQSLSEDEIKLVFSYVKEKGQSIQTIAITENTNVSTSSENEVQSRTSLLTLFSFGEYIMFMVIALLLIVVWVMAMVIKKFTIELKEKI